MSIEGRTFPDSWLKSRPAPRSEREELEKEREAIKQERAELAEERAQLMREREEPPTYPRYHGTDSVKETMEATCRALGVGREPDIKSDAIGHHADVGDLNVGHFVLERSPGVIEEVNKRIDQNAERAAHLVGISSETVARLIGAIGDEGDMGPEPSPDSQIASVHASIDTIERFLDRLERNVRRLDTL